MSNGGFLGINSRVAGLLNVNDILCDRFNSRSSLLYDDVLLIMDPYRDALGLTEAQRNNISSCIDYSGKANCFQFLNTDLTKWPSNTGNSLLFDGTNDNAIANIKGLSANSARSIMAIAYIPSGCLNRCLCVHYGSCSTRTAFGLSVADSSPVARLWTYADDLDSTETLSYDTVHLLFGTYDGSRGLNLYVDNNFTPYSKTLSGDLNITSTSFYIGSHESGLYFNSYIYFVSYWSKYFTSTEYEKLYYYMRELMSYRNICLI